MTDRLGHLRRAAPTLFAWHVARALVAIALVAPLLEVLGDSRWYATASQPARVEIGLLAAVALDATNAWGRTWPWLAVAALAYFGTLPLATSACHRALRAPANPWSHLRWAWSHARGAYAIAAAAIGCLVLCASACATAILGWLWLAGGLSTPVQDIGVAVLALLAAAGFLATRTAHDVAMAALADGSSSTAALRATLRPQLILWTLSHAGNWLAIAVLWSIASAHGFALWGSVMEPGVLAVVAHQSFAFGATGLRSWWLACARDHGSRPRAAIAATRDANR